MSALSRKRLSDVVAHATEVHGRLIAVASGVDPTITDITFDSRQVSAGSLFCCVRGDQFDGHDFASVAVAAGASAIVVDHELDGIDATQLVVDDTRRAMAYLSSSFFGEPSRDLIVVGITGTNGKTTTAHIVSCALQFLGASTATIGTLSGPHTTPEAPDLQRRLAEFRDQGRAAVAMEVSSHALALDRVLGTRFRVGVFTNLGRDHLDLHGTTERYFAAKARLFERDLTEHGVINADDVHGRLLMDAASIPVSEFSIDQATDLTIGGFEHSFTWRGHRAHVRLGGHYNVMNSLAAATVLEVLGYEAADIVAALGATTSVPGRFEPVDAGQDFFVVVDYAHTPDALSEVLASARIVADGHRVIVVFGCGGDRDHEKRPMMGLASVTLADQVVVTSDNPRSEAPLAIINDVLGGVPAEYRSRAAVEPDRLEAIAVALRAAGPGDVVVIAGKGHETTQTIEHSVLPFDDRAVARRLPGEHVVIAIIFAGGTAMIVSLVGTRLVIRFFQSRGKGQPILGKEDLGPEHHMAKTGTPTMGGLAIVAAAFAGWMVAHVRDLAFSNQAEIAWVGILVMAGMGFLDDYLKVKRSHNRGVFWKKKSYITLSLSVLLAWWLVSATSISTTLSFTRADLPDWHMPWYVWVLWAGTMIWATSNAVNVTDGLDGLAAGSAMIGFLAFTIIGYMALRYRGIYTDVVNPLDLAVLGAAFAGACAGFLWFNAAPARIFMGDVGALALGTALSLLALTLNTHLLLILICGINVMEAGSVGIQMIVFKASGRKKRLFKMSPIHHHFELLGWPETTVIIRFWLIAGISVASALALFIADFTKQVHG